MGKQGETGVSTRIAFKKNLGNHNGIEIALEGTREEMMGQVDACIDVLGYMISRVNDHFKTQATATRGDSPPVEETVSQGDSRGEEVVGEDTGEAPTFPDEQSPSEVSPDEGGEEPARKIWPNKYPGDTAPKKSDKMYKDQPLYICGWCSKTNTAYKAKKGQNKGKAMYSCNKNYGGCGWWYVWGKG